MAAFRRGARQVRASKSFVSTAHVKTMPVTSERIAPTEFGVKKGWIVAGVRSSTFERPCRMLCAVTETAPEARKVLSVDAEHGLAVENMQGAALGASQ